MARLPAAELADPYPCYQALRETAPVCRAELPDGLPVWLVTRHPDVRQALADPRLGNDPRSAAGTLGGGPRWRPENLHNMLRADPPRHTRLRRLAAAAFTARRVQRLRPRIAEIAAGLLDDLAGPGRVDLIERYAFPLPIVVICELLGIPAADRDRFREWTAAILRYATDPAAAAAIEAARDGIRDYLTALIAAKRAAPGDDLTSALIAGGGFSETELLSTVSVLLTAGHETTANLIGNGTLALLRRPSQLAALRDDPGLLPGAVEELLRYDTPIVPGVMKFARADTEIAGVPIPAGDVVLLGIGAANRDPEVFADPDRLDVTRARPPHLSFGHGIHFCIGAGLARLETQLAVEGLLRRFPAIRLAVPAARLRWRGGFIRGLVALPVRLVDDSQQHH